MKKMKKVVYNNCYGGFSLSPKAIAHILYQNKPDIILYFYITDKGGYRKTTIENCVAGRGIVSLKDFGSYFDMSDLNPVEIADNIIYSHSDGLYSSRHDPRLVKAIEELGDEANGYCAELRIAEIDSDMYIIDNYDGMETVITPEGIDWINI